MPRTKKNSTRRPAVRRTRKNNSGGARRAPTRRPRAVARHHAAAIPSDHPASMVPAACRALALSSPCAAIEAAKTGAVKLEHCRDITTALNTTVLPVQGPVQVVCNSSGQACIIVSLCPTGAIRFFTDTFATDTFADLPSGGAFRAAMERYRPISLEVNYVSTASAMLNQGNLTIAALDPAMASMDYLYQSEILLSERIRRLKDFIDSRSPQSYQFAPLKSPNRAVIGVQDAWDYMAFSISPNAMTIRAPGNSFINTSISGANVLANITSPVAKTLYYSDLLPAIAVIIDGAAASSAFTLNLCALFEALPASAMLPTVPAPSGGSAGFSNIAAKVRTNAAALSSVVGKAEKVEHVVERGAESLLKVANIAGVPYAGDASMVLHAGQSGLEKFEHWMGFSG